VASDNYFFAVSRYIELNPVRAKMVGLAGEYPWSSYRYNGMGIDIGLITPHQLYNQLGGTKSARLLAYRNLFEKEFMPAVEAIRLCSSREWVIGSELFIRQIEDALGRKINCRQWGGDRKSGG
jgi:putative transposase